MDSTSVRLDTDIKILAATVIEFRDKQVASGDGCEAEHRHSGEPMFGAHTSAAVLSDKVREQMAAAHFLRSERKKNIRKDQLSVRYQVAKLVSMLQTGLRGPDSEAGRRVPADQFSTKTVRNNPTNPDLVDGMAIFREGACQDLV